MANKWSRQRLPRAAVSALKPQSKVRGRQQLRQRSQEGLPLRGGTSEQRLERWGVSHEGRRSKCKGPIARTSLSAGGLGWMNGKIFTEPASLLEHNLFLIIILCKHAWSLSSVPGGVGIIFIFICNLHKSFNQQKIIRCKGLLPLLLNNKAQKESLCRTNTT